MIRFSAGDEVPQPLRSGDLVVSVMNEGGPEETGSGYLVEDTEVVAEVLEELARLRRGT